VESGQVLPVTFGMAFRTPFPYIICMITRILSRTVCVLVLPAVTATAVVLPSRNSLSMLVDQVSIDSLTAHIGRLANAGGDRSRVTFTRGNDSAAAYIRRTFDRTPGLTSVVSDTFAITANPPWDQKKQVNIVATFEGRRAPAQVLLLGAHYDASASRMGSSLWNDFWSTIDAPGADDNATGVAALLEIARVLGSHPSGYTGDITLKLVAFATEESGPEHSGGHGGSRRYAEDAKNRGEQIVGMVSVDMIGYNPDNLYTAIVSNPSSSWLGERFRAAVDTAGIALITDPPPFPQYTFSDHETFWAQGYDAICLIENAPPWVDGQYYAANPFYHTSWDTIGTLNMELVRHVTQGVLAMTASLAGTTTAIAGPAEVPSGVVLHQNFPNPFNPTTTITFELPATDHVSLRIYDMLGREVRSLMNNRMGPGTHSVRMDAGGLASGVYVYRLQAGDRHSPRTMVLLK
jgi:hypothetical protein